jgi:hypothetical protein
LAGSSSMSKARRRWADRKNPMKTGESGPSRRLDPLFLPHREHAVSYLSSQFFHYP